MMQEISESPLDLHGKDEERCPFSFARWFFRFVICLILLLGILYAGLLLMARTDGFAHLLERRIEKDLQVPLEIGSAEITRGLDLILHEVRTTGEILSDGRLGAERVELHWNWARILDRRQHTLREIKLLRPSIYLVEGDAQDFKPAFLHRLVRVQAAKRAAREAAAAQPPSPAPTENPSPRPATLSSDRIVRPPEPHTDYKFAGFKVSAREGHARILTTEGAEVAWFDKLSFTFTPGEAEGRKLLHYWIEADCALHDARRVRRPVKLEFVEVGTQRTYLQLEAERELIDRLGDFWKGKGWRDPRKPVATRPIEPAPQPPPIPLPIPQPVVVPDVVEPTAPPPIQVSRVRVTRSVAVTNVPPPEVTPEPPVTAPLDAEKIRNELLNALRDDPEASPTP